MAERVWAAQVLAGRGWDVAIALGQARGWTGPVFGFQQTSQWWQRWGDNLRIAGDADTDRGAHGPFDGKAHSRDPVLWLSAHRTAVLAGLAAATACGSWLAAVRRH